MAILAHLDPQQRASDRRVSIRRMLKLPVYGSTATGEVEGVIVHDLSVTGLLLETSEKLVAGENIEVELSERGRTRAIVVWNSGNYYGCEFDGRISSASVSAAVLRSPFDAPGLALAAGPAQQIASAVSDADEGKLPAMLRAWILVGLVVGTWAVLLALVNWLSSTPFAL